MGYSSAGIGTPSTITPATTDGPHGIRLTAISSIVWMPELIAYAGYTTAAKALPVGTWTTA
jgi:hypothetical protein